MSLESSQLSEILKTDPRLDSIIAKDIRIIGYCPNEGYTSWLFQYKQAYVILFDEGNGYYSFDREVDNIGELVVDKNIEKYNKHNKTQ